MRKIGLMTLEEGRMPLFDIEIDQVRFNTTISDKLADTLAGLNQQDYKKAPIQVDIPRLAEELLWSLRWFVAEG
jgi:hypothetical protein